MPRCHSTGSRRLFTACFQPHSIHFRPFTSPLRQRPGWRIWFQNRLFGIKRMFCTEWNIFFFFLHFLFLLISCFLSSFIHFFYFSIYSSMSFMTSFLSYVLFLYLLFSFLYHLFSSSDSSIFAPYLFIYIFPSSFALFSLLIICFSTHLPSSSPLSLSILSFQPDPTTEPVVAVPPQHKMLQFLSSVTAWTCCCYRCSYAVTFTCDFHLSPLHSFGC